MMQQTGLFMIVMAVLSVHFLAHAFTPSPLFSKVASSSPPVQFATIEAEAEAEADPAAEAYKPKWKKLGTLAEEMGSVADIGYEKVGLKGTIPVVFNQGNDTRTSMAFAGQPLRDVASQAGQYIKYGCGKGECGTCECMVDGKWIRPCIATVPAMSDGDEYSVQLKANSAKSTSSGTFFSVRSFIMGFWNNILGMVGFVKMRRAARANWEERQSYEDRVAQRTKEIRTARLAAYA
jgi:ferredoxin